MSTSDREVRLTLTVAYKGRLGCYEASLFVANKPEAIYSATGRDREAARREALEWARSRGASVRELA